MFDTHCHLNFDVFENNINSTILKARENGVDYLLVPGIDLETSKKAVQIALDYANTYAACGIHPTEDLEKLDLEADIYKLHELIRYSENVQAVGEIGLDYYKFTSAPRVQKMFLLEQIKVAIKLNKAVIFHNRHATEDLLKMLKRNWSPALQFRSVFHCAEADDEIKNFAMDKGVYIGVDGDLTFDLVKQHFVKNIPLEYLVLETDSPNLTPEPVRNETRYPNEPKNLKYIASALADIKNTSLENVISQTTKNAKLLFATTTK